MNFTKAFFSAGIVLLSTLWSRPLSAQWNSYDAMMSNNVYSRGWVNPYDNTYTNMYQSYSYTPTYNTYTYFGSGSRAIRAARRSAYLKKMPPRQRTEAQKFAKYNGTMYKPSATVDTAGKVAAIFARGTGANAGQTKTVMRELWNLYVTQAKSQNAPTTDFARTMAYCISANYYYYTGEPECRKLKSPNCAGNCAWL
jgi:hypothetical protein